MNLPALLLLALALALVPACEGKGGRARASGAMRLQRGDVAGALADLRAAVAAAPRDADGWWFLGDALFEAQRYEEAEKAYRSALELDPGLRPARRSLAQLALRRGRIPEAERLLRELAAAAPRDIDAQLALGTLLAARGDLAGARAAFAAALAFAPRNAAALYNLGRAHLRAGDVAAAEAVFTRLGAAAPYAPYAAYGRALVATRRGHADPACADLATALRTGLSDRRAVERDPELAGLRGRPCFRALFGEARR